MVAIILELVEQYFVWGGKVIKKINFLMFQTLDLDGIFGAYSSNQFNYFSVQFVTTIIAPND